MKRTLLAAGLVALTMLAGCGNSDTLTPAAPTASAGPAASAASAATGGIPALTGTPTDVTAASQAQAGTGSAPTELLTEDVVVGTGAAATLQNTVDVRYTGTLYADGTLFDSSWSDGDTPVTFPLNGVVPGFAQGIEGMAPGGRRVIVIPPDLGYGDSTRGPIPGGSTLVFVVDLVGVSP